MIDIDFPSAETKTGAGGRRMMGERGCGGGGGGGGGGGSQWRDLVVLPVDGSVIAEREAVGPRAVVNNLY